MRNDLRNVHISIGVGLGALAVGCVLLRHAGEDALELLGLATFAIMIGTLILLEGREERRHKKRDQ